MHSLEHRPGARLGGVESPAERRVFLLECAYPLADTRRIGMIVRSVEMAKALLRRQGASAKAGELFGHLPNECFQLANCFDVRSSATRFTAGISLMIRPEIVSSRS